MTGDLHGRTALVTGGTSGFGRAIASTLAARGARVVIAGRDPVRGREVAAAIAAAGPRPDFVAADLVDVDAVQALARETIATVGVVDILVNNAGVGTYGATADIAAATFDRDYALNVRAPFLLVGALAPLMAERGSGSIVNISSGTARRAGPRAALYGSTKAALEMLAKNWALEYGPHGVRVNVVAPGPADTDGSRASAGEALPAILADFAATLPLRHVVTPQAVADAAAWLVGDEAAAVTGAVLRVDAGYAAA